MLLTLLSVASVPLITIFIVICVVGVLLWLAHTYLPMGKPIKNILTAVVVIVLVIWILDAFGLLDSVRQL